MSRNLDRQGSPLAWLRRGGARLGMAVIAAAAASTITGCPGQQCVTDGGNTSSDAGGGGGGPVSGAVDTHCLGTSGPVVVTVADGGPYSVQPVHDTACQPDAGIPDGGIPTATYGSPMFNAQGEDDDCKYHVTWSATPIAENADVWFTVSAVTRSDFSPLTNANTIAEVFLNSTHPAPNSGQKSSESFPGTYLVGPIKFDAPGQWTVRFHFKQQCVDLFTDSPHGHAAFYVNVP